MDKKSLVNFFQFTKIFSLKLLYRMLYGNNFEHACVKIMASCMTYSYTRKLTQNRKLKANKSNTEANAMRRSSKARIQSPSGKAYLVK